METMLVALWLLLFYQITCVILAVVTFNVDVTESHKRSTK